MSPDGADPIYRVVGWSQHYENNRSRELKKLDWVLVPNKMDGDGYTELMEHANGAAHLGAWLALLQIASKCSIRGTLLRDSNRPHDPASLSRISRIPKEIFEEAIPRYIAIGWLESVSNITRTISQDGAGFPQDGAEKTHGGAVPSLLFPSNEGGVGETQPEYDPSPVLDPNGRQTAMSAQEVGIPNSVRGFHSDFMAAWAWYRDQYPGMAGREATDKEAQAFRRAMKSDADIATLYENLPLWKASGQYQRKKIYSPKNFLEDGWFRRKPPADLPRQSQNGSFALPAPNPYIEPKPTEPIEEDDFNA